MDVYIQISVQVLAFHYPRSGIAGLYDNSVFTWLLQEQQHSGCVVLRPHPQCTNLSTSLTTLRIFCSGKRPQCPPLCNGDNDPHGLGLHEEMSRKDLGGHLDGDLLSIAEGQRHLSQPPAGISE
jgi:hypothetical protein